MSKRIFQESGMEFSFPSDWIVFKYDEHRFYQYLSGSGLKGVDFIAISKGNLYLIEVKNYTERFYKEDSHPMDLLISAPETYVDRYYRKFEDTFRLLDIIESYYHRKWWYRNLFPYYKSWIGETAMLKKETGFWSAAIDLLKNPAEVKLVLWLELAPEYPKDKKVAILDYFQKTIQSKIPKEMSLIIANSKKNPLEIKTKNFIQ